MVAGPIPWNCIHEYALVNGFAGDEVQYEEFIYVIMQIDEEFVEVQNEASKKQISTMGRG